MKTKKETKQPVKKETKEKKTKSITPKTIIADLTKLYSKTKKGDRLLIIAVADNEILVQADSISGREVGIVLAKVAEDMV